MLKNCRRAYGSLPRALSGFLVRTLTVWPCAESLDTSLLPTRPVAPAFYRKEMLLLVSLFSGCCDDLNRYS